MNRPSARHDARARRTAASQLRTSYHFQAPAEEIELPTAATRQEKLRSFRRIGSDYLDEKNHRGYLLDFAVYALLTGLVGWSLVELGILVWQAVVG